jgi:hypothetical protein
MHTLEDLSKMGAHNVVARRLWPAAFEPYDQWSSHIAEARSEARCAAQALKRRDPSEFRAILEHARFDAIKYQMNMKR